MVCGLSDDNPVIRLETGAELQFINNYPYLPIADKWPESNLSKSSFLK